MTTFHRTLARAVALTTMLAALATIGMQTASAGGYGGGFGSGYDSRYKGGYSGVPSHISHRRWGQHVDWCHERFLTYREHDNTYQPYSGPRRKCWSPYISG